jgi:hypothetical protein
LTPGALINEELQELAGATMPIMEHLGLRPEDEESIRSLAPAPPPASGTGEDAETGSTGALFLGGMIDDSALTGADVGNHAEVDRLRIKVLVGMLERLLQATACLCQRLRRKLDPPSVRDRVSADVGKGLVLVDGKEYVETANVAIFFKHLAEADGKPVSGPQIAKAEMSREFKTTRVRKQIKHEDLKLIIKQEQKPNGRYYIGLPPLD